MRRQILYFKMLKSIRDAADCPLTVTEKADFDTAVGAYDFDGCFEQLDNHTLPEKYKLIADGIRYYKDISPLADNIETETNVVFSDITDDIWKMHVRPLIYKSTGQHFFLFTSCSLLEEDSANLIDITAHSNVWIGIEHIWNAIADNAEHISSFNQMIEQKSRYKLIFVTNVALGGVNEEHLFRTYSYAYLCHINESKFQIPQDLMPSMSRLTATSLTFKANNYEQYFDVYNALNDAKHATNILTQFMHIYQAIELLAYRLKMVKLVNSTSGMKQSAVRQLMSYAKIFKEDEVHSIIRLFATIFVGIENSLDRANLGNPFKSFLEKNYNITYPHNVMSNEHVAKLVYQLRNSIVHNKDTELHFTFNNIEEYRPVIPVIKDLLKILPEFIVKLLNDNNQTRRQAIEYSERSLKLY